MLQARSRRTIIDDRPASSVAGAASLEFAAHRRAAFFSDGPDAAEDFFHFCLGKGFRRLDSVFHFFYFLGEGISIAVLLKLIKILP